MKEKIVRFKMALLRNKPTLQGVGLIVAALMVTAYVLLEFDIFYSAGEAPARRVIELDEVPILGTVLCLGLLTFSWWKARQHRAENAHRVAAQTQLHELAFQDPLTGLPNRRYFMDALKQAVKSPPRAGAVHALMMLDLNGFKQINDVFGHGAGDDALIHMGKRLLQAASQGDVVARLGGDEFAILAEQLPSAEGATSLGLRILDAIGKPLTLGSIERELSTALGICVFPFGYVTPEEVLRRADVALYRAKAERKAALRFFDEYMDTYVKEREMIERELRKAIANNQILPFFQPLVDLKTREIIGFEALARWTHVTLGSIPPDRFIPIAEDAGLIEPLTRHLFKLACQAAATWPSRIFLAFNISAVQLKDKTVGLKILSTLAETGLHPSRLEIELTESALVRDLDAAKEVLGALRDAGVAIALDDFGTGYSSLYHLRNFKLDKIKIDRSFVQNMQVERESAEIVAALIGLGKGLGLKIVAEGIETADDEANLALSGCEQGQGYLFGRAVPAVTALGMFEHETTTPAALPPLSLVGTG